MEVWRRGSIIASWLLDLTAEALVEDSDLRKFSGRVSDSGEGRWTTLAAVDEGVPVPVIAAALFSRFESRGNADYADRVLSAMRKSFGGHDEKKGKPEMSGANRGDGRAARSDALVLFGVTGDLAYKKIFPALYAMVKQGTLNVPVVGVASTPWNIDQLQTGLPTHFQNPGDR